MSLSSSSILQFLYDFGQKLLGFISSISDMFFSTDILDGNTFVVLLTTSFAVYVAWAIVKWITPL